jgi:hypothetical protein
MKSLTILTLIAVIFVAPGHAYEHCKSFKNAELKAMTTEGLEKAYCWNEDRLIEILDIVPLSQEARRDRDACWETLITLSAQPTFDRQENCPSAAQADTAGISEETTQRKRDLLRSLGITGETGISAK